MDENEREIARILQEEMKLMEGGGDANSNNMVPPQNQNDSAAQANQNPLDDEAGVRAPDQSRMQVLSGPDPYNPDDYNQIVQEVEEEQRRL